MFLRPQLALKSFRFESTITAVKEFTHTYLKRNKVLVTEPSAIRAQKAEHGGLDPSGWICVWVVTR